MSSVLHVHYSTHDTRYTPRINMISKQNYNSIDSTIIIVIKIFTVSCQTATKYNKRIIILL